MYIYMPDREEQAMCWALAVLTEVGFIVARLLKLI
jgi:hypothetical protein